MDSRNKALDQINNMLLDSINESKLIDSYERLPANAKYIWTSCVYFSNDARNIIISRGEIAQIIRDKANSYDRNEVEDIFGFVWTDNDNDNDNAKQPDKVDHVPFPSDFVDLTTIFNTLQEIQTTQKNRDDTHSNAIRNLETTRKFCDDAITVAYEEYQAAMNTINNAIVAAHKDSNSSQ
ncbi:hypothetical protein BDF14DRAFT_1885534 [Spinellus fusiger]|nr:hypothetical protein BDF14DRAFT_1885534 [Spinellus fusiger]